MSAFKRNALTFGITFCISFLIFGIVAYLIMSMFFGKTEESKNGNNVNDMVVGFENSEAAEDVGNSFTALLVGTDYQPKVIDDVPSYADSIILVRFSCETNTVIYMNIPAVTRTTVDGNDSTLSQAYADKGIEYLKEKIQSMTGLQINYHAIASIAVFDDFIDYLGGIEYPVPINMEYEDEEQDLVIDLDKGTQKLDGENAIEMLRYCSDSYNDRMLRNVQFIRTLIEKYTQLSYQSSANDYYTKFYEDFFLTNFEEEDLLKHMDTIYSYSSFESKVLTFPGEFKNEDSGVYFVADSDQAIKMLAEYKNY